MLFYWVDMEPLDVEDVYSSYVKYGYYYIEKNFEKIGYKLSKMTETEKYRFFAKLFHKIADKKNNVQLNDAWMKAAVNKCLELYDENNTNARQTTELFIYDTKQRVKGCRD